MANNFDLEEQEQLDQHSLRLVAKAMPIHPVRASRTSPDPESIA